MGTDPTDDHDYGPQDMGSAAAIYGCSPGYEGVPDGEQPWDDASLSIIAMGPNRLAVLKVLREVSRMFLSGVMEYTRTIPTPPIEGDRRTMGYLRSCLEEAGATVSTS